MATTQEDVTRCDICEKRKDVRPLHAEVWEAKDMVHSEKQQDYCEMCRTRLYRFIARGTHKPGWKPETK